MTTRWTSCSLLGVCALTGCAVASPPRQLDVDAMSPDAARHESSTMDATAHDGPAPADAPSLDAHSAACALPFAGVLATWDFAADGGMQSATAVASSAPGLIAGGVHRAPSLTAASGAHSINASNWPTTAQLDPGAYYAVSITPPTGCALSVTALAVDARASATGPASARIATTADGYTSTANISTSGASVATLSVTGATGPIEIRIYGFAASAAAGTLRLQSTLQITGALN